MKRNKTWAIDPALKSSKTMRDILQGSIEASNIRFNRTIRRKLTTISGKVNELYSFKYNGTQPWGDYNLRPFIR